MNPSKIHPRMMAHIKVKELMQSGLIQSALDLSKQTVEAEGPHLGLLCDKAACEYELGLYNTCQVTTEIIEKELNLALPLISNESARRTYLMLSKLTEESGEIEKALKFLCEAHKLSTTEQDRSWNLAQELRLLSYLGLNQGLSQKYLSLHSRHEKSQSLEIETLHSLMWTEWRLFGWNHAILRKSQLLGRDLNNMDQRLLARDFLEISLMSDQLQSAEALESISFLSAMDLLDYDRALLNLAKGDTLRPIKEVGWGFSKMMNLRLILLSLTLEKNDNKRMEIKRKYIFLLDSVSPGSKQILSSLLTPFSESSDITLSLNFADRSAYVEAKSFELTKIQLKIFQLVSKTPTVSLEMAANQLWPEDQSEGLYDRLRMAVYRINRIFEKHLGVRLFEITKHEVSIHARLRIVIS